MCELLVIIYEYFAFTNASYVSINYKPAKIIICVVLFMIQLYLLRVSVALKS